MLGNNNHKGWKWILLGSLVYSFFLSMNSIFFPASQRLDYNDSSIYQYIGYAITQGKVPYADVIDHKGLYFYFLNALGYLINARWGMWLLIWMLMFLITICMYHICRKYGSVKHSLLITVALSTAISATYWDGDTPDNFAILFTMIAASSLSDYILYGDLKKKNIVIAGISTSIAFWMKPNMILGTGVIFLCLIIYFLSRRQYKLICISVAWFALSFFGASIPLIIWLWRRNALAQMFDLYFLFNLEYALFHPSLTNQISAFSYLASRPIVVCTLVGILLVLFALLRHKGENDHISSGLLIIGTTSFVVTLIYASIPGNTYAQYVMLFYPSVLLVLLGAFLRLQTICIKHKKLFSIITAVAFVIVISLNILQTIRMGIIFWTPVPQETDIVNYIVDISSDGDTIASVSPYHTGLYIATGRDSATKYAYVQANHYVNMDENPEEELVFWKEYGNMLIESKPRVIIYDKGYSKDEEVKKVLMPYLSEYSFTGESALMEFYVLPKFEDEIIPEFYTDEELNLNSLAFSLPREAIEAYKREEITLDDFMQYFDEAWEAR